MRDSYVPKRTDATGLLPSKEIAVVHRALALEDPEG
jgi:hypothetical protein